MTNAYGFGLLLDDYLDYTSVAYYGGRFWFGWGDNSNKTGDNPDGNAAMDLYVSMLWW